MKRVILFIILIGLFLFRSDSVQAVRVADDSAMILNSMEKTNLNSQKRIAIKNVLKKYKSPLLSEINSFISACETYEIDCYLLPSISGLESTFGQFIYPRSHNPFGWGGGYIMFDNWNEGINTVAKGLKTNYIARGADTVEKIAPIYAESKTWAPRVANFMNEFKTEEQKINLLIKGNNVEL